MCCLLRFLFVLGDLTREECNLAAVLSGWGQSCGNVVKRLNSLTYHVVYEAAERQGKMPHSTASSLGLS